jgi:hypothetical protein
MVLHSLLAFLRVDITEVTFAVAHDQYAGHAEVVAAFLQISQVSLVFRFIFKELVDILYSGNTKIVFGFRREIKIV